MISFNRIHSNHKYICIECHIPITIDNDSGWEYFTEDGITTQPVCLNCWKDDTNEEMKKSYSNVRLH